MAEGQVRARRRLACNPAPNGSGPLISMMLFEPDLPSGMRYEEDFLAPDEEAALLAHVYAVPFSTFEMHGVAARRRVAFFGQMPDMRTPVIAASGAAMNTVAK